MVSGTDNDAGQFILGEINKEQKESRNNIWGGVDWDEVEFQIKAGCFSDSDMGGLRLASRRVEQELTIFRSIMLDNST